MPIPPAHTHTHTRTRGCCEKTGRKDCGEGEEEEELCRHCGKEEEEELCGHCGEEEKEEL